VIEGEAPGKAPQPEQHPDDTTGPHAKFREAVEAIEIGPNLLGLKPDEKTREILEWARAIDIANGMPPVVGTAVPTGEREGRYGTVCLSDVQPEAVDWLWFGRLALGKLTLIDGDPGLGKSLLSLDSTARVTTGSAWPDGLPCAVSGSVLLLGAEDGLADTVRPRLDVAHAAIHRVHALPIVGERPSGHPPSIPDDIPDIEAALVATGAILLVIDPLMAFLGGKVNSHHDQDVRRALAPLAEMADRLRVAVLVIRHLNKSSGGPAIYRGGGSIGLAGAARIVLAVGSDPEDESRRILASVKSNLSAPPPSLAYQLVEERGTVRIEWLGTSTLTAGQLLAAPVDDDERSALDDAVTFLADQLSSGSVAVKDVKSEAQKAGISDRTLTRAKARAGVVSERVGFGKDGEWSWTLPTHRVPRKPIDSRSQDTAPYGESWPPMVDGPTGDQAPRVLSTTLPEGMRHSACPRCGAVATVLAAAADSLCAGCMPLTPTRARAGTRTEERPKIGNSPAVFSETGELTGGLG
jgi:AAA domain